MLTCHLTCTQDWTYPPFSGTIADGYVWGRGSMDVKISAVALLEAAAALLDDGYSPERTLMFAFGQDEEVGGACGAGMCGVYWGEGGGGLVEGVVCVCVCVCVCVWFVTV
eukprot:jgi/Chrzof1/10687/Cz05g08190.t1